jgi:hypothetical protein
MQSAMIKKSSIKRVLQWVFGGSSIVFVGILFIMTVHDVMKSESSNTAEYCKKYGFLASPGCW